MNDTEINPLYNTKRLSLDNPQLTPKKGSAGERMPARIIEVVISLLALTLAVFTLWRQESFPYQQSIFSERLSAAASLNATVEETLATGLAAVQTAATSPEHEAFGEVLPRYYSASRRVEILMPRTLVSEREALEARVNGFVNAIASADVISAQSSAREVATAQAEFESAFSATYVDRYEK